MCSQPFAAHTHNEWVVLLRRLSVMGRCSGTVDERSGQECSHSGCSLVHSPPKICCVVRFMHMHEQPQDNTNVTVPFVHSFVYIFSRPTPTCLGLIPFRRPLVPYGTICPVMHPLPGRAGMHYHATLYHIARRPLHCNYSAVMLLRRHVACFPEVCLHGGVQLHVLSRHQKSHL